MLFSSLWDVSAPSNRFLTFWKVKRCQTTQWIKGFKVCALSRLHECVVVVAACLVVVICWSVSDMLDANLDPDSVRYSIRDSYCKLHQITGRKLCIYNPKLSPDDMKRTWEFAKECPDTQLHTWIRPDESNLEDTKVCFS